MRNETVWIICHSSSLWWNNLQKLNIIVLMSKPKIPASQYEEVVFWGKYFYLKETFSKKISDCVQFNSCDNLTHTCTMTYYFCNFFHIWKGFSCKANQNVVGNIIKESSNTNYTNFIHDYTKFWSRLLNVAGL